MGGPAYYKGRKPIRVSVKAVVELVQLLSASGKVDAFLTSCGRDDAYIKVDGKIANQVKAYLHGEELHESSTFAKSIVGFEAPECDDPYECNHIVRR